MSDHSADASPERAAKRLKTDASPAQVVDTSAKETGIEAATNGSSTTDVLPAAVEQSAGDGIDAPKTAQPDAAPSDVAKPAEIATSETKPDQPQEVTEAKSEPVTSAPAADVKPAPAKIDARDAGRAPVKAEYLITREEAAGKREDAVDDDAAEGRGAEQQESHNKGDKKRRRGQNKERTFGNFDDSIKLCHSRTYYNEFSPRECKFGDNCKLGHDLRKYLEEGRRPDATTFNGKCHVFETYGRCPSGWKCRFVKSHMKEVEHEDGRKELVLLGMPAGAVEGQAGENEDERPGVANVVAASDKINLSRRRVDFSEADKYITWANSEFKLAEDASYRRKRQEITDNADLRAQFTDPPVKASEKRKLYFGRETPVLAPLTTQGNLPFRRLCVELGAELTYSEMAMSLPLIQGTKADWTLMKAHETEIAPPKFTPGGANVVQGYDNSKDLRFGAQISANLPWVAIKATEVLKRYVPHLRVIDLNCGCPVDAVFKTGSGSALLDTSGKLERIVRGMNTFSGDIPVSAKLRMGVKTGRPNATTIISKLAFGSREIRERLGAPGCAAITLHGRSREQRYSKRADWGYIAECAALIKTYNEQRDRLTDTIAEPDASTLPAAKDGRIFFLGNGDCYSHVDYFEHVDKARVDSVMIGRGALVKPWLFEEIEKGQYLDKSATERLAYIEKFVRYGLEAWGSDELGLGFTRRFLLEWLSFTHRYVPIGLLEHLPPNLNDRPPLYRGRNELETLLASPNYRDWIKISEMFLGPCHPGFTFQPKHKSNSYEAEG
ncbi:dihydrouridine synthase [Plectosphaerella plurivora]|uniref:tRNA-dihydrouridine(47) synthase [NAD(P)(+)] n=1 Tax=Plectosphaerella plurivora TaxID=936078 RepID=A0A9P8VK37_9PEZI|nr:dihydrouridine synthase [Plectosphaerella plurivora]